MIVPAEARPLLEAIAPRLTRPTFHRFVTFFGSTILTTGRRTVANILRTAAPVARGHRTTYQRVLPSAEWEGLQLACQVCRLVLALLPADQPVILVGDDTVDGHPGSKVYGKARHRDPVRSSHGYTSWRYGHKWVVRAVLVRFPLGQPPLGTAGPVGPVSQQGGGPGASSSASNAGPDHDHAPAGHDLVVPSAVPTGPLCNPRSPIYHRPI